MKKEHELEKTLDDNEQVLTLKNLQERRSYDIRVLVRNSADEIMVLTKENITTKGTDLLTFQ